MLTSKWNNITDYVRETSVKFQKKKDYWPIDITQSHLFKVPLWPNNQGIHTKNTT